MSTSPNVVPKYNFKTFAELFNTNPPSSSRPSTLSKPAKCANPFRNKNTTSNTNHSTSFRNFPSKPDNNTSSPNLTTHSNISTLPSTYPPTDYSKTVKQMETLIDIVKANAYDKYKEDILTKTNSKQKLQSNIKTLTTFIRLHHVNNRNYMSLTKGIQNENERLTYTSQKVARERCFFARELPTLKQEVDEMKQQIAMLNDETRKVNNDKMLLSKEIDAMNDDVKKYNMMNSQLEMQREKMRSAVAMFRNNIAQAKGKVKGKEREVKEFIGSLKVLANKTKDGKKNVYLV